MEFNRKQQQQTITETNDSTVSDRFRAWLAQKADQRTIDWVRSKLAVKRGGRDYNFSPLEDVGEDEMPHTLGSPEENLLRQELVEAILKALPEQPRDFCYHFFVHGYTHAEIAEMHNLKVNTVSKAISRGVQSLREFLDRQGYR